MTRTDQETLDRLLIAATVYKDADWVESLLERGADANAQDGPSKISALCYAVRQQDGRIMRMLIGRDANVNHRDAIGVTPLMTAAFCANAPAVRLLLDRGARINDLDDNNRNALIWAVSSDSLYPLQEKYQNVIKMLLDGGVDTAVRNHHGHTAPDLAKKCWQVEKVFKIHAERAEKRERLRRHGSLQLKAGARP
jgi:ankyrin repeat protein